MLKSMIELWKNIEQRLQRRSKRERFLLYAVFLITPGLLILEFAAHPIHHAQNALESELDTARQEIIDLSSDLKQSLSQPDPGVRLSEEKSELTWELERLDQLLENYRTSTKASPVDDFIRRFLSDWPRGELDYLDKTPAGRIENLEEMESTIYSHTVVVRLNSSYRRITELLSELERMPLPWGIDELSITWDWEGQDGRGQHPATGLDLKINLYTIEGLSVAP